MQPAFVKQLQQALDAGQVVLVPPPAKVPDRPPLRNRSESSLTAAFCLLFKLARSEGRVLTKLFLRDYGAKEDLQSAGSTSDNSVQALICVLRKKLKSHGIRIATLPGMGYAIDKDTRSRIHAILAQHDAGFVPRHPRSKPKAADQPHTE
jgi:DNA-binding response OmpR family regulator